MKVQRLQPHVSRASVVLKSMSNERRLMVLLHLAEGEKSVGELESLVGLSQSALSQHLARLRRDAIVQTRREAQTIYYSLKGGEAESILNTVAAMYAPEEDDAGAAARAPVRLVEAFEPGIR